MANRTGFEIARGDINVNWTGEEEIKRLEGELEGLAKTMNKISMDSKNSKDFVDYWGSQETAIERVNTAYKTFEKTVNKDTSLNLVKSMNALQAIAGTKIDFSEMFSDIPNIESAFSRAMSNINSDLASIFSVDEFKDAFKTFQFIEENGGNVQQIFQRLGKDTSNYQQEIRSLERQLESAQRELYEFKKNGDLTSMVSHIKELEAELENTRRLASLELRDMMQGFNINPDDYSFSSYFEDVENGSITAIEAIKRIKTEYSYLFEENFNALRNGEATFDSTSSSLGTFEKKLTQILTKIEELSGAIAELRNNNPARQMISNLSGDEVFNSSQQEFFKTLLSNKDAMNSLSEIIGGIIKNSDLLLNSGSNSNSSNPIFNPTALEEVSVSLKNIEESLQALRTTISDVGDGQEFSPLLTTINDITSAVQQLNRSVSGIRLNINFSSDNADNALVSNIESKKASLLSLYQQAAKEISFSGLNDEIAGVFRQGSAEYINFEQFKDIDVVIGQYEKAFDLMNKKFKSMASEANTLRKEYFENAKAIAKEQGTTFNGEFTPVKADSWKNWTTLGSAISGAKASITSAKKELDAFNNDAENNPLSKLFGGASLTVEELNQALTPLKESLIDIQRILVELQSTFSDGQNIQSSLSPLKDSLSDIQRILVGLSSSLSDGININNTQQYEAVVENLKEKISTLEQEIVNLKQSSQNLIEQKGAAELQEESQLTEQLAKNMSEAAIAKDNFSTANEKVKTTARESARMLGAEATAAKEVATAMRQAANIKEKYPSIKVVATEPSVNNGGTAGIGNSGSASNNSKKSSGIASANGSGEQFMVVNGTATKLQNTFETLPEAKKYFTDLLSEEDALITSTQRFGQAEEDGVAKLEGFSIAIKRENGEINKLNFSLQELDNDEERVAFTLTSATQADSGIISQFERIKKKVDETREKLSKFNADTRGVFEGTAQYKAVENAINGYKNDRLEIQNIEQALKELMTLRSTYLKTISSGDSLNPFENRKRDIANFDESVQSIEATYNNLGSALKSAALDAEISAIKKDLESYKKLEADPQVRGTDQEATAFHDLKVRINEVTEELEKLKNNSASIFTSSDLSGKNLPFVKSVDTVNELKTSLESLKEQFNWKDFQITNVEENGGISNFVLRITDENDQIKKLTFERRQLIDDLNNETEASTYLVANPKSSILVQQAEKEADAQNKVNEAIQNTKKTIADLRKESDRGIIDSRQFELIQGKIEALNDKLKLGIGVEGGFASISEYTSKVSYLTKLLPQISKEYKTWFNLESQISSLQTKQKENGELTEVEQAKLNQLISEEVRQRNKVLSIAIEIGGANEKRIYEEQISKTVSSMSSDLLGKNVEETISKVVSKVNNYSKNIAFSDKYAQQFSNISQKLAVLNEEYRAGASAEGQYADGTNLVSNASKKYLEEANLLLDTLSQLQRQSSGKVIANNVSGFEEAQAVFKNYASSLGKISKDLTFSDKSYNGLYKMNIQVVDTENNIKNLAATWGSSSKTITVETKQMGSALTVMQQLSSGFIKKWSQLTQYMTAMYLNPYMMISRIKEVIDQVIELDSALVDLSKTANMTTTELNDFYVESNATAKEMGVTTQEIIEQASAWSRLGYNTAEAATEMAKLSSQFATISPGMDTESAQTGLVSIMKAWDISVDDVETEIMDKINTLGNNFALTNQDIIDGMEKAASALSATGTSWDEAFALFTGGQEILQDADSMGTALRSVSLRLRGYSEDAEDGTLEIDDSLKTISGDLIDLTKTAENMEGISIFTDDTKYLSESEKQYKSLVEYLGEISDAWDTFSDVQKNNLLQTMFGKTRANAGAALITNFDAVRESIEAMSESMGSSDREMEKYESSLEYKTNRLSQTWVGLWQNLIDRGDLGNAIDALNSFSEAIVAIISKLGIIGTSLTAVISIFSFKKIASVLPNLGTVLSQITQTGVAFQKISKLSFDANSAKSLNEYRLALEGLNESQVKAALTAHGLNAENKELIINSMSLDTALLAESLTSDTLTKEQAKALIVKAGIATADEVEQGATIQLSTAKKKEIATTTALTEAEKQLLLAKIGVQGASVGESFTQSTNAFDAFVTMIKKGAATIASFIQGLFAFVVANAAVIASIGAIGTAVGALALYIYHQTDTYILKQIDKFQDKIDETVNKIQDLKSEIKDISNSFDDEWIEKFAKLSQGVDVSTGENQSLNTDDYDEYLEMSQELADTFPTLTRIYDENGNAIVQLGGPIDTITEKLQELIEVETKAKDIQVAETLPELYTNVSKQSSNYDKLIAEKQSEYDNMKQAYDKIIEYQESGNKYYQMIVDALNGNGENTFTPESLGGYNNYLEFLDAYENLYSTGVVQDLVYNDDGGVTVQGTWDSDAFKELESAITTSYNELKNYSTEQANSWSQYNTALTSWIASSSGLALSDIQYAYMQQLINGTNWSDLGLTSDEEIKKYILSYYDELVKLTDDTLKSESNESGNVLQALFQIDPNDYQNPQKYLDALNYIYQVIQDYCNGKGIVIPVSISDKVDEDETNGAQATYDDVMSIGGEYDDNADTIISNNDKIESSAQDVTDNIIEQLEEAENETSDTIESFQEKINSLAEQDGSSEGEAKSILSGFSDNIDKLKSSLDSLSDTDFTGADWVDVISDISQTVSDMGLKINWEFFDFTGIQNDASKMKSFLNGVLGDISQQYTQKLLKEMGLINNETGEVIKGQEDLASAIEQSVNDMFSPEKLDFSTATDSLDKLQESFKTLTDVLDDYNSQGYLTLDNLQSLITADDNYIKMLKVEGGQLVINEEAYKQLVYEQLLEFKTKLQSAAAAEIAELANNDLKTSVDENTTSLNTETTAFNINSGAAIGNAVGKALSEGVSQDEINAILDKYQAIMDEAINGLNTDFSGFMNGPTTTSGGSGSSSDAWLEEYKDKLSDLEDQRDQELISEKQFYSQSEALMNQYLKDTPEHIEKYASEITDAEKDLHDAWGETYEALKSDLSDDLDENLITQSEYYEKLTALKDEYYAPTTDMSNPVFKTDLEIPAELQSLINTYTALQQQIASTGDVSDEAKEQIKSALEAINEAAQDAGVDIDDIIEQTYKSYGNFGDEFKAENKEISEGITSMIDDIVSNVNSSLDSLQSAFQSVSDAVEEYNEKGALSLDTVQGLLELEPAYLSLLFDENGQLQLNKEAYEKLAKAKLKELKIAYIQDLTDTIKNLKSEESIMNFVSTTDENLANQTIDDTTQKFQEQLVLLQQMAQVNGVSAELIEKAVATAQGAFDSIMKLTSEDMVDTTSFSSISGGGTDPNYTAAVKELEHAHNMEEINTKDYYEQMLELARQYYGEDSDEYREAEEALYSYMENVDVTDWAEKILEVASETSEKITDKVDDYFSWQKKNAQINKSIAALNDEIALNVQAYKAYANEANNVNLPTEYKEKVRSGAWEFEPMYDEKISRYIEKYQEWYDKAQDCLDKIEELYDQQRELIKQRLDNVTEEYSEISSYLETIVKSYEDILSLNEAMGKRSSLDDLVKQFGIIKDYIAEAETSSSTVTSTISKKLSEQIISETPDLKAIIEAERQEQVDALTAELSRLDVNNSGVMKTLQAQIDKKEAQFQKLREKGSDTTKLDEELNNLYDLQYALLKNANSDTVAQYETIYKKLQKLQNKIDAGKTLSTGELKNYNLYMEQLDALRDKARETTADINQQLSDLGENVEGKKALDEIKDKLNDALDVKDTDTYNNLLDQLDKLEEKIDKFDAFDQLTASQQKTYDKLIAQYQALQEKISYLETWSTDNTIDQYNKIYDAWRKLQDKIDAGQDLTNSEKTRYVNLETQMAKIRAQVDKEIAEYEAEQKKAEEDLASTDSEEIKKAKQALEDAKNDVKESETYQLLLKSISDAQAQIEAMDQIGYDSLTKSQQKTYDKLTKTLEEYNTQKKALEENATKDTVAQYNKTYLAFKKLQDKIDAGGNLSTAQWTQYRQYKQTLEDYATGKSDSIKTLQEQLDELQNPSSEKEALEKAKKEEATELKESYAKQIKEIEDSMSSNDSYKKILSEVQRLQQKQATKKLSTGEQNKLDKLSAELKAMQEGATLENANKYMEVWEKWYSLDQERQELEKRGKTLSSSKASKYDELSAELEAWKKEKQAKIDELNSLLEDDLAKLESDYDEKISEAEESLNDYYEQLYELAKSIAEYNITSLEAQKEAIESTISLYEKLVSMYETFDGEKLSDLLVALDQDSTKTQEQIYQEYLDELKAKYQTTLDEISEYKNLIAAIQPDEDGNYDFGSAMKLFQTAMDKYKANGQTEMANYLQSVIDLMNTRMEETGDWDEYADEWALEWEQALEDVQGELIDTASDIQEIEDALRELNLKSITDAITEIERLQDRLSSVADLYDDDWLFNSKTGQMNEFGTAKVTTLVEEMKNAKTEADKYLELIDKIKESKDTYASEDAYKEALADAESSYYDSVSNVKSLEDEIVSIMTEANQAIIDSLNDLIDKRKEALQAQKDLYEYNKTVSDSQKEIDNIKAQIDAMENLTNATDAATKAKIAQLKADLEDKEESLQETKDDHVYELQVDALDELSEDLEDILNQTIDSINKGYDTFTNAINSALDIYDANKEYLDEWSEGIVNVIKTTADRFSFTYQVPNQTANATSLAEQQTAVSQQTISTSMGQLTPLTTYDSESIVNTISSSLLPSIDLLYDTTKSISDNVQAIKSTPTTITLSYGNLLNVEGNVDKTVMADMNEWLKQACDYTKDSLYGELAKLGMASI